MTRFNLKDGDKLLFMSDGIVEATDAHGHLFGF
jgi:serine phosphatase RsbU (regulator of sigma subunit)